jgi:hypothetical protein
MPDIFSKPSGLCTKCGKRPADNWWIEDGGTLAAVHGFVQPWCEVCCLERQLEACRAGAAKISELEEKLRLLKEEVKT